MFIYTSTSTSILSIISYLHLKVLRRPAECGHLLDHVGGHGRGRLDREARHGRQLNRLGLHPLGVGVLGGEVRLDVDVGLKVEGRAVCIYIYIFIHIYTHTHTYICTYVCPYIYTMPFTHGVGVLGGDVRHDVGFTDRSKE